MSNFLAGIKKIEYAFPDQIQIGHSERLTQGVFISVAGTFSPICIEGLASVEYETKKVSDQNIYTTKLIFRAGNQEVYPYSLESIILNKNIVYLLTDIMNYQYLLGINKAPFPAATVKHTNPGNATEAHISEYEITYINIFSILDIICLQKTN
ncbi:hypothetical protein [Dysgonomonas macrotermitis]|uniref:Uncharacterized protein n=1 Tax=Dysgonomonas macrotermitis TaxID=1346286 RepID=A0A1M4ULQ7_9BACT|nr:hypothetical protein [Dysgonomonas macrotermitis]SHE57513.1 hypothetical protein SAMN05444362_101638 [Dysgonomonas macrotermitis]